MGDCCKFQYQYFSLVLFSKGRNRTPEPSGTWQSQHVLSYKGIRRHRIGSTVRQWLRLAISTIWTILYCRFVVSATVTLLVLILITIFSGMIQHTNAFPSYWTSLSVWNSVILVGYKRKTGEFISVNSSPFRMSIFIRRTALVTALTVLAIT